MILSSSSRTFILSLLVRESAGFVALPAQQRRGSPPVVPSHLYQPRSFTSGKQPLFGQRYGQHEDPESQDETVDVESQDWMAFRAKLIQSEPEIYKEGSSATGRELDASNRDAGQIFDDWRSFRAKLVRGSPKCTKKTV